AWLELGLKAADPSRDWDVVNCGGVSYASYRLVPILEEVLGYDPDLLVVCTGQNEFLEDRSYAHIKDAPEALAWPQRQISGLRTYNMLRGAFLNAAGRGDPEPAEGRAEFGPESDAMLDWKGGV